MNTAAENFFSKSSYWKTWVTVDPDRVETRFIKKKLRQEKGKVTLLDVACGNGRLLKSLSNEFKNVDLFGIDINKNAIRLAKKAAPKSKVKLASVYKLPFPDLYFDIVVIPSSFMHFEKPKTALKEITRVCKKWIFFDLSTKSSISQALRSLKIMPKSNVPEFRYDYEDIEKILPKKDFDWEISGALLLTHKLLPKVIFKIYERVDFLIPQIILKKIGHTLMVYGSRKNLT